MTRPTKQFSVSDGASTEVYTARDAMEAAEMFCEEVYSPGDIADSGGVFELQITDVATGDVSDWTVDADISISYFASRA